MTDMAKKIDLNENSRNAPEFKLNPGSTSILLIFVTLCLVAFAVLCVVSSNSDRKLGNKVIVRTGEYYAACNKAQTLITGIDEELNAAYLEYSDDKKAYYEAVGGTQRSFVIDIDEAQKLYVELTINFPDKTSAEPTPLYRISSWKVGSGSTSAPGAITIE